MYQFFLSRRNTGGRGVPKMTYLQVVAHYVMSRGPVTDRYAAGVTLCSAISAKVASASAYSMNCQSTPLYRMYVSADQ